MSAAEQLVEVDGLVVRYGEVTAVNGVSFAARAGEVTVVLGPNGAGKTSTIEVCEGYRRSSAGRVRVLGLDPAVDQRRLSERIGVMLQDGGVYPSARVLETVSQYCALYGRGADPAELVERVGLAGQSRSGWRRLSGGQRQRLSLALALAARPDVAFLDEPTSGVDINGRDEIRAIVAELAGHGCAVVLATHELDEAERIADHAVIFNRGRVVAAGSLDELRRGQEEIRFRSDPGLDVDALATALGHEVQALGGGEFVVTTGAGAVAVLSAWLADHGLILHDLRAGAVRLEDVFRRLTSPGSDQP